jgi:hypothetical protein
MSATRSYPWPSSFTCSRHKRTTGPLFPLILVARLQQNQRLDLTANGSPPSGAI